jgi:hypothetical protein
LLLAAIEHASIFGLPLFDDMPNRLRTLGRLSPTFPLGLTFNVRALQ